MEVDTPPATVVGDLPAALEQAALMAKQLSTTTDPTQLQHIYTALQSAHHHLSLFFSHHQPPPLSSVPGPQHPENSVSSAVGDENGETGGGEPMQMGDDEDEQNSRATTSAAAVEKVEERMRECFIQNKRPKRPLSPSAAVAELRRSYDNEAVRIDAAAAEFDPIGTKLRSLDILRQFHA